MSSKSWVESPRLEIHLDWLLSQLEPRTEAIPNLLVSGVEADFFCYSSGASEEPPPVPRSIRDRATSLGIDIRIDHYRDPAPDTL